MNRKRLLIEEPPIQVLPSLAVKLGLNEAIILQQLHYWISNPKSEGYFNLGYKWVYNTLEQWQKDNFPFWSISTVKRAFKSLEDSGLVISRQFNKDNWDRKKYYRIDYKKLDELESSEPIEGVKMNQSEMSESPDQIGQNEPFKLTETTSETTPEITILSEEEKEIQRKERIAAAIRANESRRSADKFDVSAYPEDVRPYIKSFCELWNIKPPSRGKKGGSFAMWIEAGRELADACSEFGIEAITEYRKSFEAYMQNNEGLAPFDIVSPKSIINSVRAMAGKMRTKASIATKKKSDSPTGGFVI